MFFSVIVPCYNVGPAMTGLLRDLTQQMDEDCELVLINDGSTDDTSARIRAFIDNSTLGCQIVLKEMRNAGAAKARATGLSLARGEYVFFCDSDDLIGSDFIAQVRRQVQLYPQMDLMYFSSTIVADSGEQLLPVASKIHYEKPHSFARGDELLRYHLNCGMYTAAVWTFVVRRTLIVESGAVFTDRLAHEDHLFTLKVIMGARSIIAIPNVLYRQKIRAGSLTNSRKSACYVIERIAAYQEADQFLSNVTAPRGLYRRWSFQSVMYLLSDNPHLLSGVIFSSTGAQFFAVHLFDLLKWLGRAAARRIPLR